MHRFKHYYLKIYTNLLLVLIIFLSSCNVKEKRVTSAIQLDDSIKSKCYDILYNELKDKNNFWVSIHAAEALTLAGKSSVVKEVLEKKLEKEKDGKKICGIAREFVRAGDRSKVQLMLNILSDKNYSYAHIHACESLYKVNEIGDGKLLLKAMEQKTDSTKQLFAAAALEDMGI